MSKKVNSNSLFRKSKYITNVGYLNTKISPRRLALLPEERVPGSCLEAMFSGCSIS